MLLPDWLAFLLDSLIFSYTLGVNHFFSLLMGLCFFFYLFFNDLDSEDYITDLETFLVLYLGLYLFLTWSD